PFSFARPGSVRPVARQRDAVHAPAMAVIVVDREVLRRAVVPERDQARLPPEAEGEVRVHLMAEQLLQHWAALRFALADKAHRVRDIDIERLPPGLGV